MTETNDCHTAAPSTRNRLWTTSAGITVTGMAFNVALSAIKVAGGLLMHSQALVADGIHSLSDLVSDIAVLAGLGASHREADGTHLYGHRRVQTLVNLFLGGALSAAALYIGLSAGMAWRRGETPVYGWGPFAIAAVSIVLKEVLFRATIAVSRRTGDTALQANAWHHRSDAFSSLAVAAGMFGVAVGGESWAFLDPLAAIALAGVLVTMGLRISFTAAQELIDRAPARAVMENIAQVVAQTPGVRTYHAFRMRQMAGMLEMDVHVQVDPNLSVAEGHDIAAAVRRRIFQADRNVGSVIVHVEPAED